jgi:cytidyltransferase-like protein
MTGKVVLTDGVFDLLHANHVAFLEEARSFGDRLVVGIVSDANARTYKRTPIVSERERLAVVEGLACVDEAFIIDGALVAQTMEALIAALDISAVVYAGASTPDFYGPAERAGIMHRIPYRDGVSSSDVIARIVERSRTGTL